ncbi:DDB1- and CUL4-associated factor 13-like [Actinia tenebrosa]|uniref:DDB1- and CUL4-associated factor 13-like n=1 Tax=Actinia tenebrosa TaxID=6105 RepID=A0A6P8H0C4_ACTTE|nr:DDB1- and CUL4-associated factor 13-like [Actinia tenebrosa]
MKVKILSRNPEDHIRERKSDIHKLHRNLDPSLHPFEAPREYTRALNATKLERVFAKPFVGALDGHTDGVNCLARHPRSLSVLLSGSCDGEIKLWHLPKRECIQTLTAHTGFVRGLCVAPKGDSFFSVGDEKVVKQWSMDKCLETTNTNLEPINTIIGKTMYTGIDHNWKNDTFATCGQQLDIWDESRADPIRTFTWGVDTVHSVKYNPIETNILASTASDRSVVLYDTRGSSPLRKLVMAMRSNTVAWNPIEAYIFTAANEDSNLYTYDMRRLDQAVNVHMDHVSAVLDVDYAPTGQEFVSGSFDKSIRIFERHGGHSREVYHTRRMQRVFCVRFSADSTYVLSGSDETNIRIWKANASQKLGALAPREKEAFAYSARLKERFKHHPRIRRIQRHRHVPKAIYKAALEKRIMSESQKRKDENRRLHSKPGTVPRVAERKKQVVAVVK